MKYNFVSESLGYTTLSATYESFERNEEKFRFKNLKNCIKKAGAVAAYTNTKQLIVEQRNFTNRNYDGIGWVYPDGEYYEI